MLDIDLFNAISVHGHSQARLGNNIAASIQNIDFNIRQILRSANGRFYLIMQDDGNLVIYRTFRNHESPIWASDTCGKPFRQACIQTDGNFVLYGHGVQAQGISNTCGHGPVRLIMQDDGNLVLQRLSDNHEVWSSGSHARAIL